MRKFILCLLILFTQKKVSAQATKIDTSYERAYNYLSNMLGSGGEQQFKKAVFITENAYCDNKLSYADFEKAINSLKPLVLGWIQANPIQRYYEDDSLSVCRYSGIFAVMKDTIGVRFANGAIQYHYP